MHVRCSAVTVCLIIAACLGISACGSNTTDEGAARGDSESLLGAGSTLVAPLLSQWRRPYARVSRVNVDYSAIGSGGGIAQITARTVDFGASDAPLTADQATEAQGVLEIPWALAATCVAYHLHGVKTKLKLTGPLLAKIYEGKVTSWDDPAITRLNPDAKLPRMKIVPVYRSDGSGDTYAFTDYLSHVSGAWRKQVSVSTQASFPTGVSAKGNSGVGGIIASVNGSIGYLAIAYTFANKFSYALIRNTAGEYPPPDIKSITAAATASSATRASIVDPPSSATGAYPISTFTYALVPRESPQASLIKPFLRWAITKGQRFGPKLDFAPLPKAVVTAGEATIKQIEG